MAIEEFDQATQDQLRKEDSEAWSAICTILGSIITVGLCLACLTIWAVNRFM